MVTRKNLVAITRSIVFAAFTLFYSVLSAIAQNSSAPPQQAAQPKCNRTITASLVALDQVVMINRLGAARPGGMIYALERDVVPIDASLGLKAGNVMLRSDKRPRPIVLRVNIGDCLQINFRNLLSRTQSDPMQPITRYASIHVTGMELVNSITDDGTFTGANPAVREDDNPSRPDINLSGVVPPDGRATYTLYAAAEGTFLLYSKGADFNGFRTDQLGQGMFGAVNVEPPTAEYYRSQVTHDDLKLATKKSRNGKPMATPAGQPIIDYDALFPADYDKTHPDAHNRACAPVLKMVDIKRWPDESGKACKADPATLEIYHTDLTAIITGPKHGRFSESDDNPDFRPLPVNKDRRQPFREVTVHYHESQDVVQAFPYFYDPANKNTPTLNAGQDTFAINYSTAGIAPEIIANRIGVGPARECAECKFEEFFLSSWAGGDPSMLVDKPANFPCTDLQAGTKDQQFKLESSTVALRNQQSPMPPAPCAPSAEPKATRVYYPDDPSNVYHAYVGDHIKFHILHASFSVHHVHHHHAHQWLHSPNSDDGHYLDSQAIGPGSSFTLELVYNGSGNRNLTVGDSIFHCHFYPHFASGMWALHRVHDVFEEGTELIETGEGKGKPKPGARALPDGEIAAGTPIPAVVPLPTLPMAPMPAKVEIENGQVKVVGKGNPGYPFFVPGIAGHRAPHPPLDFAIGSDGKPLDGGLPRHVILDAKVTRHKETPTDFTKDMDNIKAVELPEDGTDVEKRAIAFFGQRRHPSFTPEGSSKLWNGQPADFITNGLPRKTKENPSGAQQGAPFADPAVGDNGEAVGTLRRYKGVNLQVDAVLNKAGWHFPQQRMMALWNDVPDLVSAKKPPEPLFFRANSGDVVEYWHTNLVPGYYELDDFEVRTPTDILGQHIHLVKFDVMASDGSANGFNYEDGTFSPDEVRDRINGINQTGGLWSYDRSSQQKLTPKSIPELGDGPTPQSKAWVGAQATVQRWYVDPLTNNSGFDRTYMTVFTHDHYGPSTHQMVGLYGGLLVEPKDSKWTALDGTPFGSRSDGGPTSYAANILPTNKADSYREFALMWEDLQLVYAPTSKTKPDCYEGQSPPYFDCNPVASQNYLGWADPQNVINCPNCNPGSPGPNPPQPFLIADFGLGVFSMNYRAEPLALRVNKPTTNINPKADGYAADLSHAFRSIERFDKTFSAQPAPGSPIVPGCTSADCFKFPQLPISDGMLPQDPYTPLLRAYENDKVQIRVLAGAHTSMHDFMLHGLKWKFEPFNANSGWRNSQFVILSEHFEMLFKMPRTESKIADYLYNPSASFEGLVNGTWGILRAYKGIASVEKLAPLPNNPTGTAPLGPPVGVPAGITTDCTTGKPCLRRYNISALTIAQALGPNATLKYNSRGVAMSANQYDSAHPIEDPNAIIYVRDEDIDPKTGMLKEGLKIEPLVLRAAAGDWIQVTLSNRLDKTEPVFTQAQSASRPGGQVPYSNAYASVNIYTSTSIGLHAQLVGYDITKGDGANVGLNPIQTVSPDDAKCPSTNVPCKQYLWYAGDITIKDDGKPEYKPVEFGAINLMPSDRLMHVYRGLFGGMIIEPVGATWIEDPDSRASATVFKRDTATGKESAFREFVLMTQDDVDLNINNVSLYTQGNPLSAFNYRTEPFFYRYGSRLTGLWLPSPGTNPPSNWANLSATDEANISNLYWTGTDTKSAVSNWLVSAEPQTPTFRAPAFMPVRFRLLNPGGIGDNQQVFELTGHVWQEEPYKKDSTEITDGIGKEINPFSNWTGTTPNYGPSSHYEVVIGSAGGRFGIEGDYLYRSWTASQYQVGLWGLFRVAPGRSDGDYPDTLAITSVEADASSGTYTVKGFATVYPKTRSYAKYVTLSCGCIGSEEQGGNTAPVDSHGWWSCQAKGDVPEKITVTSPHGGEAVFYDYAKMGGRPPVTTLVEPAPMMKAQPAAPRRARPKARRPRN